MEKWGRPRKQIYEDELPEIYTQKGNRTKVESDSDSDPDYSYYLKQTQAKNRKKKNTKKQKILLNLKAKKVIINFMCSGAETRFVVTAESNGMLCIPLQSNIM